MNRIHPAKYVLVFVTALLLVLAAGGCTWFLPGGEDDHTANEDSEPDDGNEPTGGDDSGSTDGGFGIRTITGVSARAFDAGDEGDAIEFRSSDISFWALETPDDIGRTHSNPVEGEEDPLVAVRYDLGNVTLRFESGGTIESRSEEIPEFDLGLRYNFIRIDIGAGFLDIYDDEVPAEHLYAADETELFVVDNDLVGPGLNCNSVILLDDTWVSTPVFIPRGETSLLDPGSYETLGLTQSEADIYRAILERGRGDGTLLDVHGALFMPFTPDEFEAGQEVESVTVEFVWDMVDAFVPYLDGYQMEDRTGNGLSLDFDVRIAINESDG